MGIRKIIYGILQLGAESTATTQATAVIQSTSGSLALVPSGSGALTANIPDGTAVGGNARGQYAVDLQLQRSNANEVATSQNSFIGGGWNNKIIGGSYGAIVSGRGNTLNSNSWYTFIGGGFGNSITGDYSTISGGQSNTASTNTHATVVGGFGNTSSGGASITGGESNTASNKYCIAFGYSNTVSGGNSSAAIGYGNQVSGVTSYAIGQWNGATAQLSFAFGQENVANSQYSFALGYKSKTYLSGQLALSHGIFAANADAQQSLLTARKQDTLTTGATSSLSLDGTGTSNLIIPSGSNRAWNTTVNWVATVTGSSGTTTGVTVGDSIYGVSEFGFKKNSGIASITPLIRDSIVADTAIMETATLTYATGSSNSLAMTFTAPTFAGSGSLGMRVVAKVSLVELAW